MRPSENFSFSIYPEKHVHQLLETRAMLEPSQEHVMFFFIVNWVPAVACVRRLDTNHPGGNIVHKHHS